MHNTHDVRKSQTLAQIEINFAVSAVFKELETSLSHVLERLHALEEKGAVIIKSGWLCGPCTNGVEEVK